VLSFHVVVADILPTNVFSSVSPCYPDENWKQPILDDSAGIVCRAKSFRDWKRHRDAIRDL